MTTTTREPEVRAGATTPRRRDVAVLVCLAGASGGALVAQVVFHLSMTWTAGLLALPASGLLVGVAFAGRREHDRLAVVADRIVAGAFWGLVATLAYDAARPLLVWGLSLDFAPYRAHATFGTLVTGQPRGTATATIVGWGYHFWNGIGFATMFALVRPRGPWWAGLIWALGLQALMMALYPRFLEVRLDDPGFLVTTIVGHGVYGVVLGATLARRGPA